MPFIEEEKSFFSRGPSQGSGRGQRSGRGTGRSEKVYQYRDQKNSSSSKDGSSRPAFPKKTFNGPGRAQKQRPPHRQKTSN